MRVRYKDKPDHEYYSSGFNTHALNEVIINSEEFGSDSEYINRLDVFLNKLGDWKDMRQAFIDKDLINDNYNTVFFEPGNDEDRERGYTL